jgi:hypothetical protein
LERRKIGILANKKLRFQPLVKMGMKTVDKNIDKKTSNDLGVLMQLSRLMSIFMASGCVFRPKSLLGFLIDGLIYDFHTHFDQGLKAQLFCSPQSK